MELNIHYSRCRVMEYFKLYKLSVEYKYSFVANEENLFWDRWNHGYIWFIFYLNVEISGDINNSRNKISKRDLYFFTLYLINDFFLYKLK